MDGDQNEKDGLKRVLLGGGEEKRTKGFSPTDADADADTNGALDAIAAGDDNTYSICNSGGKENDMGEILSDDDLRILTDRSEAAYERAEKGMEEVGGEKNSRAFRLVETRREGGEEREGV